MSTADSKHVFINSADGQLLQFNTHTMSDFKTYVFKEIVSCVQITKDDKFMFACTHGGDFFVFDLSV